MAAQKLFGSLIIATSLIVITCFAEHDNIKDDTLNSEVKITNNLEACIKITPKQTIEANGFLLLDTDWQTQKSIGECGCKSALMNYSVNVQNGTKSGKTITEAIISSIEKKDYNFIINADASIKYNSNYEIIISCKTPD